MQTKNSKFRKLSGHHGFIMLALLLILVITGSSFVLAGLNNRGAVYLDEQVELHRQLAEAKASLLAYVVNSNAFNNNLRGPGFFPCPDTDNDKVADSSCDPVDAPISGCAPDTDTGGPKPLVGRLPEYVLDASSNRISLNNHYAKIDQQFWYVVAPRYVYNDTISAYRRYEYRTSTSMLTSVETPIAPACMRMSEDANSGYIAFIIAPGEALDTQDRPGGKTSYSNYLDGHNGAGNYHYYTSYESNRAAFNDQIIGITLSEYVKAVAIRVALETIKKLDEYHQLNSAYPASADFLAALGTATNPVWLIPDTAIGNNGELWSKDIVYSNSSSEVSTVTVGSCAGISFTLNFNSGISRSGVSC